MAHEMKTRISQGEVGPGGCCVAQGFFPQEHRSVARLTQQGQFRVRDGAGITIERRSLSGTQGLLCSTQQEPVPTY